MSYYGKFKRFKRSACLGTSLLSLLMFSVHAEKPDWLTKLKIFDHNNISFLVVQQVGNAYFSPIKKGCYQIQLQNLSDTVLYFSDQPKRVVGYASHAEFLKLWHDSGKNFRPNAAISGYDIANSHSELTTLVLTLSDPQYNVVKNSFSYSGCITDTPIEKIIVPKQLAKATLFIDDFGGAGNAA